jgi:hypothetical protein
MFLDNLSKMQKIASINWVTHPKLEWEYVIIVSLLCQKKLLAHTSTFHAKWGTMFYLLLPIWTKRNMAFGHLPTHVPSIVLNNFDGGKEEMSIM